MLNIILLIVFILLQIADGVSTYRILQRGIELNPILFYIFERIGLVPGLLLSKGLAVALGVVAYLFAGVFAVYTLGLLVAVYAWVVGHNIRQL